MANYLLFDDAWLSRRSRPANNSIRFQAFGHLVSETDRYLSMDADAFVALPVRRRFLIWHNALLELWLRSVLLADPSSVAHGVRLALSLSGHPEMGLDLFPSEMEKGTILSSLAIFYDLSAEQMEPSDKLAFAAILHFHASELRSQSCRYSWGRLASAEMWNHTVIAYAGIGLAGLAMRDSCPEAKEWMEVAIKKACGYLQKGITANGANREGAFYAGLSMKCLAPFMRAAIRIAPAKQTEELRFLVEQRAPAFLRWLNAETVPSGGQLLNSNDSILDPHLAVNGLLMFTHDHNPQLAAHVWNRLVGSQGTKTLGKDRELRHSSLFEACLFLPEHLETSVGSNYLGVWFCREQGRLLDKSGTDPKAAFVSFSGGSFAGFHDHSDRGSFTMFEEGHWLVIDSGVANRKEEGSGAQSIAHNTILIDGRGQALSGAGHGVNARVISFEAAPGWDYVVCDCREAYIKDQYNPVELAVRHFLFVKVPAPYIVIWDEFRMADNQEHLWEFLLHTPSQLDSFVQSAKGWLAQCTPINSGIGLHLQIAHPSTISYQRSNFHNIHADSSIQNHVLHRFGVCCTEPNFVCVLQSARSSDPVSIVELCKIGPEGCELDIFSVKHCISQKLFFQTRRSNSGEVTPFRLRTTPHHQ